MRFTKGSVVRSGCAVLFFLFLSSCGMGAGDSGGAGSDANTGAVSQLSFVWPDGYSFNPETGEVFAPSGRLAAPLPAYVTRITLTITGEGLDTPLVLDVPLDTLTVSYAVPPGPKTFTITLYTDIGLTFTASVDTDLTAGVKIDLNFELKVNAPPVITSIDASATSLFKNSSVSLTAVATDRDSDDTLSYSWSGGGGAISGSGASVTFSASKKGSYTVCVTVTDGHDGADTACVTLTVQNRNPVVNSVSASPGSITKGSSVSLSCSATDPDGDPLTYSWSGSDGFSATGATATASPTATTTYTCTATDNDGATGSDSVSVAVKALVVTVTETLSNSQTAGGDIWSVTLPAAATVTITCSQTSTLSYQLNLQLWAEQGMCVNGATQKTSGRVGASNSASVTFTYSSPATFAFWLDTLYNGGNPTTPEPYKCVITPSATITGTSLLSDDVAVGC